MNDETRLRVRAFQRNEITEYHVYKRLARLMKDENNRNVLNRIAEDELRHYRVWMEISGVAVKPDRWRIFLFFWIARIFGVTFGIKLMERGEAGAQHDYDQFLESPVEAGEMAREEQEHEDTLLGMFDEDLLKYTGSVVLGINDALVELTGALAGLTLALQDGRLIAMVGTVTGIAAALSMGASEYLSTKTEDNDKGPVRAAIYTGVAYLITVVALIMPFLLMQETPFIALICSIVIAIGIIFLFNYYISVAQDLKFKRRFIEMTLLSLSVAAVSFGIGYLMRIFFNIDG